MAEKTIAIIFDGYWLDKHKDSLPAMSGVYCVYECTQNVQEKTVSIPKLIYIGEAEDVKSRLTNHEKYKDWLKHVRRENELCFTFGGIGATDRARAEAAMIFKHKPPENTEFKNSFPFDKTIMNLSRATALLISTFTVNRT